VTRGTLLVVMEAMKMEHRITCIEDEGTVAEVRVEKGEQVAAGHVLVVVVSQENTETTPSGANAG
jgi:biotin carboxyl carrier protein